MPVSIHYYLSLVPESLIASMLSPEEFGNYYALGTHKRARGQAIFFEVDPERAGGAIDCERAEKRCVPHEDGSPRKSTYLSIYRALENVPCEALKTLYLATDDGRVLGLTPAPYRAESGRLFHLYQELAPVNPRVVSRLDPQTFAREITRPDAPVSVPRIVFAEMKLEALAADPDATNLRNLPYRNIDHLRDCMREIRGPAGKPSKTVMREVRNDILYRTIRGGFYVGDQDAFISFPLPSVEELESVHYSWWRSALSTFGS